MISANLDRTNSGHRLYNSGLAIQVWLLTRRRPQLPLIVWIRSWRKLQIQVGVSSTRERRFSLATNEKNFWKASETRTSQGYNQHSGEKVLTGNERKELLESQRNTYQ